jgi:hypothetical protein
MADCCVLGIKPQTGVLHCPEMYDDILAALIWLNNALTTFWPNSVLCRQTASKPLKARDQMLKEQAVAC